MNNPDTLVAVSAYAGDIHQVEAFLPVYTHHECPVVVLSPMDAPITRLSNPSIMCLMGGLREWAGPKALARQRKFLEILLQFPAQRFLLNDSDSFCLSAQLPKYLYDEPDTIWANIVPDLNPGLSHLPKVALQPPYFLSRRNIEGMLRAADNPPPSYYTLGDAVPIPTNCPDHWMLQVAHGSGFPYKTFPDGASFETQSAHGLNTMAEHVRRHGKNFIHSVKTGSVLARLQLEYNAR